MAPKINPDSIHLGGDTPEYFAEYLPTDPGTLPEACIIPEVPELTLTLPSLTNLNEVCETVFPEVTPLPPIFNPPVVRFTPCEELVAEVAVQTTRATRNSRLTLSTIGPTAGEDGDPSICGFIVGGVFAIEACETFTASSLVTFSNQARGSTLSVESKSNPECGFVLKGNIDVKACPSVTATSNVQITGKGGGGYLRLDRSGDCDLKLTGAVNFDACPEILSSGIVQVTGKGGAGSISLQSVGKCSPQLIGNIEVNACPEVSASGTVLVTGRGGRGSISLEQITDCGAALTGDIEIDACDAINLSGSVEITGEGATGSIRLVNDGGCGGVLVGQVNVPKSCGVVDVSGLVTVNSVGGGNVAATGSISLSSGGGGGICAIGIQGELNIPGGCSVIDIATRVNSTQLEIRNKRGQKLSTTTIAASLSYMAQPCGGVLTLSFTEPLPLIVDAGITVNEEYMDTSSGWAWNHTSAPYLDLDENNMLSLKGTLPIPYFSCEANDSEFAFSDLDLNSVNVNTINGSSCCGGGGYSIDLCQGEAILTSISIDNDTVFMNSAGLVVGDNVGVGKENISVYGTKLTEAGLQVGSTTYQAEEIVFEEATLSLQDIIICDNGEPKTAKILLGFV